MVDKTCPNCSARLFDDYAEEITELEDGSFIVDGFNAYVCESKCGYVERIEDFHEDD